MRLFLRLSLFLLIFVTALRAADSPARFITIRTERSAYRLLVGDDGRLYQLGYGAPPNASAEEPRKAPSREDEAFPPAGNGYILEPALQAVHADGNTSTELTYVRHESSADPADPNIEHTRIELKDPAYPFSATLHFRAHRAEDVLEQWTEFTHTESGPVVLAQFASAAPVVRADDYWLTQFQGNYMREAELVEERLTPGIKVLDSKLGVRAHQMRNPSFLLSLDRPAQEESGTVIGGTLAWSGNFQFRFEVDWNNRLRALCGINPFGSSYRLTPGQRFATPRMLWTWSDRGKGQVSRNLHRWARRYGIRDGARPRPVLLNNWEATGMTFDEEKIVSLFAGARDLGVELFLLDDGWFGTRHPRDNDRAGLGDWQVNPKKLPRGLAHLAEEADRVGVGFGIWIEPEMVNPKSELFEQHPDWVIRQPKRELLFGRHQLVLDLTRPEVEAHVLRTIDQTLSASPKIRYVKWDCNRYITQPGSPHLPPAEQSHLLIDYQWALYRSMSNMAERFPDVMAMLCAGGSGRVDYGALKYFHSFWPSDNTDPVQRVFIQWGFGHVFPASTLSAHITDMGKKPLKFAIDVAMSGALGIDRDVSRWTPDEQKQVAEAVRLYRDRIRPLVTDGDLYRLQSPYERPQAALSYVSADRTRAVVFIYRLGETAFPSVKLRGLAEETRYRVREVNLAPGQKSRLSQHDQVVSGAVLMAEGLAAPVRRSIESAVIELEAVP
jgi:alpha-galactosidase